MSPECSAGIVRVMSACVVHCPCAFGHCVSFHNGAPRIAVDVSTAGIFAVFAIASISIFALAGANRAASDVRKWSTHAHSSSSSSSPTYRISASSNSTPARVSAPVAGQNLISPPSKHAPVSMSSTSAPIVLCALRASDSRVRSSTRLRFAPVRSIRVPRYWFPGLPSGT